MNKEGIEKNILKYLGATKVIWLPFGLAFDDDTSSLDFQVYSCGVGK